MRQLSTATLGSAGAALRAGPGAALDAEGELGQKRT